jgi:bifunctional ADP-heptose synthase (sugar kinase/adenylyltransferase)
VAVDPKKKHFHAYSGVSFFKPNLKELKDGLGLVFDPASISSVKGAVQTLQEFLKVDIVMATLSEKGVLISKKANPDNSIQFTHIPAHIRAIADVSGAGDTVISVAALCLALNLDTDWLAEMSNLAGGLVCEQLGVVSVDKNKLQAEAFKVIASKKA